jgi:hypothetical protein
MNLKCQISDSCVRIISDTLCGDHFDIFFIFCENPILFGTFSNVFHHMKLKFAYAKFVHASEVCMVTVFMMFLMTEY